MPGKGGKMNKEKYFGIRARIHADGYVVEIWDKIYFCKSAEQAAAYMRRFCDNRIRDSFDNKASYSLSWINIDIECEWKPCGK